MSTDHEQYETEDSFHTNFGGMNGEWRKSTLGTWYFVPYAVPQQVHEHMRSGGGETLRGDHATDKEQEHMSKEYRTLYRCYLLDPRDGPDGQPAVLDERLMAFTGDEVASRQYMVLVARKFPDLDLDAHTLIVARASGGGAIQPEPEAPAAASKK